MLLSAKTAGHSYFSVVMETSCRNDVVDGVLLTSVTLCVTGLSVAFMVAVLVVGGWVSVAGETVLDGVMVAVLLTGS